MKTIIPSSFKEMLKSTEIHSHWHFGHYPLSCFFYLKPCLHLQVALIDRASPYLQTPKPTQGWLHKSNLAGLAGLMHVTF